MSSGLGEVDPPPVPAPASRLEPRELTDARDMRAMAHPTRLALLEALGIHGALTATQAGALIGESPASASFHLRTLARHHFVEETGDGRGRQRPWRLVTLGTSFSASAVDDPELWTATESLSHLIVERQLTRLRQWWARRRQADPEWLDAATHIQYATWLTPDELRAINDVVNTALARHIERLVDPAQRPEGAELVEMLYFSYLYGPDAPTSMPDPGP
jgi:DNA-binding transcriptional ArsR family regulator